MADLYDTLGVAKDATKAVIKSAFRKKAKDAHPDTGGSAEKFHAIEKAHRILSDDEARERYDRTGSAETEPDNTEAAAVFIIQQIVTSFMDDDKAVYKDLVGEIRKRMRDDIAQAKEGVKGGNAYVAKAEKMKKRIRGKKGAALLTQMFEQKLREARNGLEALEQQIKIREIGLKLVEDAEFDVEKMAEPPFFSGFGQQASNRDAFYYGQSNSAPGWFR